MQARPKGPSGSLGLRGGSIPLAAIDIGKIKDLSDWPKIRKDIGKEVAKVIGKLPKKHAELQFKLIDEMDFNGYARHRINYFVDDWERISAWMFVPEGNEKFPAIVCCHSDVEQGKNEPAGIDGDPRLALARHYAEMGYVTIAPDTITAGERVSPGLEAYDTSGFYGDHAKESALGRMLVDHLHAIDALCENNRVDEQRVGVVGHGLGAQNALMLAAFDERIQVCVASCGFTRFNDDPQPERWCGANPFDCMPGLRAAVKSKSFPFDWEHILALAAPTPVLLLTALNDEIYPKTKSCEKAAKMARTIYKFLGAKDALENRTHQDGHMLTYDQLEHADAWFDRWL